MRTDLKQQLEEVARQHGFVLVDGSELPPNDNDNDEIFDGPTEDIFDQVMSEDMFDQLIASAILEAEMAEDFAIEIDRAEKREAVAQLGRIIECLSILASVQADLVKALVLED
jgi:hypothetical protein